MTIKQLKEIIKDLPDKAEVQAHVTIDGCEYFLDDELDFVDYHIEKVELLGGIYTSLILDCEEK